MQFRTVSNMKPKNKKKNIYAFCTERHDLCLLFNPTTTTIKTETKTKTKQTFQLDYQLETKFLLL